VASLVGIGPLPRTFDRPPGLVTRPLFAGETADQIKARVNWWRQENEAQKIIKQIEAKFYLTEIIGGREAVKLIEQQHEQDITEARVQHEANAALEASAQQYKSSAAFSAQASADDTGGHTGASGEILEKTGLTLRNLPIEPALAGGLVLPVAIPLWQGVLAPIGEGVMRLVRGGIAAVRESPLLRGRNAEEAPRLPGEKPIGERTNSERTGGEARKNLPDERLERSRNRSNPAELEETAGRSRFGRRGGTSITEPAAQPVRSTTGKVGRLLNSGLGVAGILVGLKAAVMAAREGRPDEAREIIATGGGAIVGGSIGAIIGSALFPGVGTQRYRRRLYSCRPGSRYRYSLGQRYI
jgi:hypothetical protein